MDDELKERVESLKTFTDNCIHTQNELCFEIMSKKLRNVDKLLRQGGKPNVLLQGIAPMHLAAGLENEDMMLMMLRAGGDPNIKSSEGLTPVHISIMWGCMSVLDLLIKHGGNLDVCDSDGKNCFEIDDEYNRVKLLAKYGTKNYTKNDQVFNCNQQKFNSDFVALNVSVDTSSSSSSSDKSTDPLNDALFISHLSDKSDDVKRETCIVDRYIHVDNGDNISLIEEHWLNSSIHDVESEKSLNNKSDKTIILAVDTWDSFVNTMYGSDNSIATSMETLSEVDVHKKLQELGNTPGHLTSKTRCSYVKHLTKLNSSTHPSVSELNNSALYQKLVELGDSPGPITPTTRCVYVKRLAKLLVNPPTSKVTKPINRPEYSTPLTMVLDGKTNPQTYEYLNVKFVHEFRYKNGQRKSFNYLLLDPRVTNLLPRRANSLNFNDVFRTFVSAIFYVGRGQQLRPFDHLKDALSVKKTPDKKNSAKIRHINDIWNSGAGVVVMHCYYASTREETSTRESCMIDAIGKENLTNKIAGTVYGTASKWCKDLYCKLGTFLLHQILKIYLIEGERQVRPMHL